MQAHQSKREEERGRERERERERERVAKKSDRTRWFQFLSTILTGIRSRQSEQKRFGFLQEERIQRVNIGDPAYRIV